MADRSVVVRYAADVSAYVAGMARAGTATRSFTMAASANAARHTRDWEQMSSKVGAAGIALGLGVGVAVKRFADFDAEMSAVQAATGATGGQFDKLRLTAIKLGADSKFSAREAAQGITEMAKAGVSAQDIIGGGLSGALALASAGQLEVGRAAEIAAISLQQFNLEGRDLGHVADLYAAAAGKAVGSVDDIAQAMKYAGVTANSMGLSIEETTGVLGLFASKGIIGEQAGTALRGMLLSLTSPSKLARKAMDDLGISLYDGSGHFIGMEAAAQVLQDKLGPLDEATRNAALGQIFGNEQMGAAIALYGAGAEGVADWTARVNDAGFAQRQAAALTNNLKGDVEKLGGALDSVFIQGGSGTNGALRELVQNLTDAVSWFGELPVGVQQSAVQLGLLAAGGLLAAAAVMKVGAAAATTKANLMAMGLTAEKANRAMKLAAVGGAVIAVAALAGELEAYLNAAHIATVETDDLARSLADLGSSRLTGGLADLFRDGNGIWPDEKIVSTTEAVKRFGVAANDAFNDSLGAKTARILGMGYDADRFAKYVGQLDGALAKMVRDGNADEAAASLEELLAGVDPDKVEQVRESLTQYGDALVGVRDGALMADPALEGLSAAQRDATLSAQDAAQATGEWATTLRDINAPALDVRAATRGLEAALDDAAAAAKGANEAGLSWKQALSAGTEAGRENQEALDGVAAAALAQVEALQANGASQADLQSALLRSRERLIAAAQGFGMSREAAEAYADSVLEVPASTTTRATFVGAGAEAAVDRLKLKLRGLDGDVATTYVRVVYQSIGSPGVQSRSTIGGVTREDGGIDVAPGYSFADSGVMLGSGRSVSRQSQIASGTGGIMWQEPVTGWEGYISGKPGARARSQAVLSQVAPKIGMRVVKDEGGGGLVRDAGARGGGSLRVAPADLAAAFRAAIVGLGITVDAEQIGRVVDRRGRRMVGI